MEKSTEEKLTYWIITTEYRPLYGGGIGTYCYHTARMLSNQGHKVTVFIYDLSLSKDTITEDNGIRIVRFVPSKTGTHHYLGYTTFISYEYAHIIKLFI